MSLPGNVFNSPIGTPPIGTPPIGTPPIGTPPIPRMADLLRSLTGSTLPGKKDEALDEAFDTINRWHEIKDSTDKEISQHEKSTATINLNIATALMPQAMLTQFEIKREESLAEKAIHKSPDQERPTESPAEAPSLIAAFTGGEAPRPKGFVASVTGCCL